MAAAPPHPVEQQNGEALRKFARHIASLVRRRGHYKATVIIQDGRVLRFHVEESFLPQDIPGDRKVAT